jgi:hypothetical protein
VLDHTDGLDVDLQTAQAMASTCAPCNEQQQQEQQQRQS